MKKLLLYIILFIAPLSIFAQFAQTSNAKKTTGTVPDELIGHWQVGTFSLTNFWSPTTGQYLGNAGEASTSYKISKDGTTEEFFIYNSTSYNCRTEILGYRKGTIKINETNKSFTFCPTTGYYRTANCFKKDWTLKEYGDKDLYPQYQFTYYWTIQDGNLVVKKSPTDNNTTTYKKLSAADAK